MPNSTRVIPRCSDDKTYENGCRCSFCKHQAATSRAIHRHRKAQRERGIHDLLELVPVDDSRLILRAAKRRGLSYPELCRITGMGKPALVRIYRNKVPRIRYDTALRIQRLVDDLERAMAPGTMVSSKKAQQIRYSLLAQGWSQAHQREILMNNWDHKGGFIVGLEKRPKIRADNLAIYLRLAEAIGNREGPSIRTRNWYASRGIFPLRHYGVHGDLVAGTLSPEQKASL